MEFIEGTRPQIPALVVEGSQRQGEEVGEGRERERRGEGRGQENTHRTSAHTQAVSRPPGPER